MVLIWMEGEILRHWLSPLIDWCWKISTLHNLYSHWWHVTSMNGLTSTSRLCLSVKGRLENKNASSQHRNNVFHECWFWCYLTVMCWSAGNIRCSAGTRKISETKNSAISTWTFECWVLLAAKTNTTAGFGSIKLLCVEESYRVIIQQALLLSSVHAPMNILCKHGNLRMCRRITT